MDLHDGDALKTADCLKVSVVRIEKLLLADTAFQVVKLVTGYLDAPLAVRNISAAVEAFNMSTAPQHGSTGG